MRPPTIGFPPARAALAELDTGRKGAFLYPLINGRLADTCALQNSGKAQDFVRRFMLHEITL